MIGIYRFPDTAADTLKRAALLFDLIEVQRKDILAMLVAHNDRDGMRHAFESTGRKSVSSTEMYDFLLPYAQDLQEYEYLNQKGIIRFTPEDWQEGGGVIIGIEGGKAQYITWKGLDVRFSPEKTDQFYEMGGRLRANDLRKLGEEAVVIGARFPELQGAIPGESIAPGNAISIIFEQLPEPDGEIPWQDVLDFRNDQATRHRLLELRRWVRKFAADFRPATRNELAEEVEYLLHEYEEYMRILKLKVRKSIWETIVTTTAEIAEDLVKFKWSHLAKVPFVVQQRRVEMLEGERSAPGRELAYLSLARTRFPSKSNYLQS